MGLALDVIMLVSSYLDLSKELLTTIPDLDYN